MQRKRRKKQENCPRTKPSDFELEGPFSFPFSTHPFLQTNIPLSPSLREPSLSFPTHENPFTLTTLFVEIVPVNHVILIVEMNEKTNGEN